MVLALALSLASHAATGILERRCVEKLIENAERLRAVVHCVNGVLLESNISRSSYLNVTYSKILNLTRHGDLYLNMSRSLLVDLNYTSAKYYAVLSIQSYGAALELQEELAVAVNASLEVCGVEPGEGWRGVEENATSKERGELRPLIVAFEVAESRIEELRELVEKVKDEGYDVELLSSLLDEAEDLVEEGRTLALAGNVSEAAHRLARAKKILGLVNSEIHELGFKTVAHKLRGMGVKVNATEIKELMKKGEFREKVIEKMKHAREKARQAQERAGKRGEGCRGGSEKDSRGKHYDKRSEKARDRTPPRGRGKRGRKS